MGSALATSQTINCSNQQCIWCRVHEDLENLIDADSLTIANVTHKAKVTYFQWLHRSKLTHLPKVVFETFPNLELLDWSTGIEVIREADLENAKNLNSIILNKNAISRIPANAFKHAANLATIEISANKITDIEDNAFYGLNKLTDLTLESNFIKVIKRNTFAGAPKLATISLKVNDITTIEDGAFNLPRLTSLSMNTNHLKSLSDNLFAHAPEMFHLDLSDNELRQVPQATISAPGLTTLVLDWNQLEDLDLNTFIRFGKLEYLSLENVGLTLPASAGGQVKTSKSILTQIDLTDNELSSADVLKHLAIFANLEEITLKSNKIVRLNDLANIKKTFANITKIDLDDNEVECNWLREVLPKIKELEITLSTGDEDESLPAAEKREVVDGQWCGKIPK